MIYGRPIGIPHNHAFSSQHSHPQAVDDKYIAQEMVQPDGIPSVNAFFVNTVTLYRVMDEIIERLHKVSTTSKSDPGCNLHPDKQNGVQSCSCDNARQLTSIIQLDGLLQNWHDSLPQHLKFSLDDVDQAHEYADEILRQRVILKIRFLGMRILLHRQTILFLLQDRDKRRWPRNASRKWPPLFSDDAGEPSSAYGDDPCRKVIPSSFEIQLAHLSARMCVQSAQMQIEMIDHSRSLKLSGAWWWDFYCRLIFRDSHHILVLIVFLVVFNSLCVLFGATGLRKEDHSAIVPALPKAHMLMQRGIRIIHDMASRGGAKVARSERFLKRLMKAAIQQTQKVSEFHPFNFRPHLLLNLVEIRKPIPQQAETVCSLHAGIATIKLLHDMQWTPSLKHPR